MPSWGGRYTRRDTVGSVDPRDVVNRYLEIADSVMPGLVEGLYLVGSVALNGSLSATPSMREKRDSGTPLATII